MFYSALIQPYKFIWVYVSAFSKKITLFACKCKCKKKHLHVDNVEKMSCKCKWFTPMWIIHVVYTIIYTYMHNIG